MKALGVATTLLLCGMIVGCGKDEPDRDEIPVIKDQIVKLEKFYRGEPSGSPDSLMTHDFYADMGHRGEWQAIAVGEETWPFIGFTRRSFEYNMNKALIDLHFVYRAPDGVSDTTREARIEMVKDKDI